MKRARAYRSAAALPPALAAILWFGSSGNAPAEQYETRRKPAAAEPRGAEARADGRDIVRIRSFTGLGTRATAKTPEYQTNAPRGRKPAGDWGVIEVGYDTAPEWIDELTFQFYVLAVGEVDGKRQLALYRTSVRYVDIERGRDHMSTVYLHPSAIKRYGPIVAAGVEITSGGNVIAEASDAGKSLGDGWWKRDEVNKAENIAVKDGYLLDRSRTPFALINVDDYEVIR